MTANNGTTRRTPKHSSIVLFYKYFLPADFPLIHEHKEYYEEKLLGFQRDLCHRLNLKGRVLLAAEGINGTLSAPGPDGIKEFINAMENFELIREFGLPSSDGSQNDGSNMYSEIYLFRNIDWKESSTNSEDILEPFPDLKVSPVKEIISNGGTVSVEDLKETGQHLSPTEFHQAILDYPDAVLIDVRNTFEYNIGHFVNPNTNIEAKNPETVTFSSFDATFCAREADQLKDKKVLMYCTGGIRCEKASVMLKKRGVKDVYQLQGGIHRYLEEFGDRGCFRGLNFVFDQRVAMKPSECKLNHSGFDGTFGKRDVVGRCIECSSPFEEICGSRICTVCRDLVLVCPSCQSTLREYHCHRHSSWKNCYFTFLDVFNRKELDAQRCELLQIRDTYVPAQEHRNVRRTISRQIEKISARMDEIASGKAEPDCSAPRRCRSCMEPNTVCDGRCCGFWKTQRRSDQPKIESLQEIHVGVEVVPGPNWNCLKLGSKMDGSGKLKHGVVLEVKSWGAGGTENDCVVVQWDDVDSNRKSESQIYRWGTIALDGSRMYEVSLAHL